MNSVSKWTRNCPGALNIHNNNRLVSCNFLFSQQNSPFASKSVRSCIVWWSDLKMEWWSAIWKQIKTDITKFYATVSPRLVSSSKKIIPSIRKDSVPTTQNSLVVYEYSCRCDANFTEMILKLQIWKAIKNRRLSKINRLAAVEQIHKTHSSSEKTSIVIKS